MSTGARHLFKTCPRDLIRGYVLGINLLHNLVKGGCYYRDILHFVLLCNIFILSKADCAYLKFANILDLANGKGLFMMYYILREWAGGDTD